MAKFNKYGEATFTSREEALKFFQSNGDEAIEYNGWFVVFDSYTDFQAWKSCNPNIVFSFIYPN